MSLLRRVYNICLLAEEHVTSICDILRDLGSGTAIFDSETCVRAIIRLENNLRSLILIICSVRSLSITSYSGIAESCIVLQDT